MFRIRSEPLTPMPCPSSHTQLVYLYITWSKEEIELADIKKTTVLTMHGGFHPKSITLRLYIKRKEEAKE